MRMEGGHEYKKGLWNVEEDRILMDYVKEHGVGKWNRIAKVTELKRCGKSCRLRWMNYLSPSIKLGDFSKEEEDLIVRLHTLLGNRWSLIAGRVPGRTDNQVKNYWNTHLSKRLGVKKEKIKVRTPSKTLSSETMENSNNLIESMSTQPFKCDDKDKGEDEKLVQANSSKKNLITSTQEVIKSDDLDVNFWFAKSELNLLYPLCQIEPFQDDFANIDWDAL